MRHQLVLNDSRQTINFLARHHAPGYSLPHHWIAQAVLMPLILMLLALGVFTVRFNVFSAQQVGLGDASSTSEPGQ